MKFTITIGQELKLGVGALTYSRLGLNPMRGKQIFNSCGNKGAKNQILTLLNAIELGKKEKLFIKISIKRVYVS